MVRFSLLPHQRARLYRIVELVGRWSMLAWTLLGVGAALQPGEVQIDAAELIDGDLSELLHEHCIGVGFLIVILGAIVGSVLLALYLPIFKIGEYIR